MDDMTKDEKRQFGRKDEEWHPLQVVGDSQLCAWQVDANSSWIQVRDFDLIRRLRRNKECRRVAYSVAGGILETFELRRTLPWVRGYLEKLRAKTDPNKNLSIS